MLDLGAGGAILGKDERPISGTLHGADQRGIVRAVHLDASALRREIDVGITHPAHPAERVLDARDARRAGHPGDHEIALFGRARCGYRTAPISAAVRIRGAIARSRG